MSLAEAREIFGWMAPAELEWLAARAREHKCIVEIGCFMGRSTLALAECPGIVYAVDTFVGSSEHQYILEGKPNGYLFDTFSSNLKEQIQVDKVRPLVSRSLEAARKLGRWGVRPDMIFIDASHDYANVKADIIAWYPLLAKDGLLCGHDYGNGTSSGLEMAVKELFPYYQIAGNTAIWHHTKLDESIAPPGIKS